MHRPLWNGCLSWTSMPGLSVAEQIVWAGTAVYPRAFGHIEIHLPHVLAHGPSAVVSALETHGVRVAAATGLLSGSVLNQDLDESRLHLGLKALRHIGCPLALLSLDHMITPPYAKAERATVTRLRTLIDAATAYGIGLAVETVGTPSRQAPSLTSGLAPGFRTLLQISELLDWIDPEPAPVGVCVDSVSWVATGAHPKHITGLGHPIHHVRVADVPERHRISLHQWGPAQRLMPGDGALRWPSFTAALEKAGYTGPLALAVSNPRIRELPGLEITTRAAQAMSHLRSGPATKGNLRRAA